MKKDYIFALLSSYLPMVVYAVSGFLLVPILLRNLGEKSFGIFMLLYAVAQYTSIGAGWLGGASIRLIGVYEARGQNERVKQVSSLTFYYFLVYGSLGFVLCAFLAILADFPWNLKATILAFGCYLLFNYPLQAIINILFSHNRQVHSNLLKSIPPILYTVLTIVFLRVWKKNILSPAVALTFSVFLMTPLIVRQLAGLNIMKNPFKIERSVLKEMFITVGLWNFIYGILLVSYFQDRVFLGLLVSPESVAKFTVVWTIPNFFIQVLWRVSEVLQPYYVRFSETNAEKLKETFIKNLILVGIASGIFAAIYAFKGTSIVRMWIGYLPELSTEHAFALTAILVMLLSVDRVFSSAIFSAGMLKELTKVLSLVVLIKYTLAFFVKNIFHEVSTIVSFAVALCPALLLYWMHFRQYLRRTRHLIQET